MKFVRFFAALMGSISCLAIAMAPAYAENHFLTSPVPVLPTQKLDQTNGDFDMATSDSGESVAFWGQSDGMWASLRPANGTFATPVQVSPYGTGTALPEVAMAPNGAAALVWRGQDPGFKSQVFASVKQAGSSTFSPAVQVSSESFQVPNVDPQVDIADNGNALIVWKGYQVDGDENSARIRQRLLGPTGNFPDGGYVDISGNGLNQFPDVAVGPNGHAMITWILGDSATGEPITRYEGPGNTDPDTQGLGIFTGRAAVAAVDANGLSVIAYKRGNNVVTGNYREGGAGHNFLFDQDIDGAGASNTGPPEIAMDGAGNATAAFKVTVAGQSTIETVDRPAGNGQFFGAATDQPATSPGGSSVTGVQLAVNGSGAAMLSWTSEVNNIRASARKSGEVNFQPQTPSISPAGTEAGASRVGIDSSGRGIAAFSSSTDGLKFKVDALPYDDVPVASGLVIPSTVIQGRVARFAVEPTDAWAPLASTEWTLGPGVTAADNTIDYIFMTPGIRQIDVKLTDTLGNSTVTSGSINVTADKTPPLLTKVSVRKKKAKVGKKNAFLFTLGETAKVEVSIKRTSKGKGKKAQGKIVKASVVKGPRKIQFRGKIGKKRLKPAKYQAAVVAIDQFGNRSKPKKVGFRILRK